MNRIVSSILVCLFAVSSFHCSPSNVKPPTTKDYVEFHADVNTRRARRVVDQSKTVVYIRTAIPNYSLTYLKTDDGFRADYEVEVLYLRDGETERQSKVRTGHIDVKTFAETKEDRTYFDVFGFLVRPGRYSLIINYKSDNRTNQLIYQVNAPIYTNLSVGSIELLSNLRDSLATPKFYPTYDDFEDLYFNTEFYNLPKGQAKITYDIMTVKGEVKDSYQTVLEVDEPIDVFRFSEVLYVPLESIEYGVYNFRITLETNGQRAISMRRIEKLEPLLKVMTKKEYKKSLKLLGYFVTYAEMKVLKSAKTPRDRKQAIYDLWIKRDAGEHKFYLRNHLYKMVRLANERFRDGKVPGWETDRGRIFIKYGFPESFESNVIPINHNHPYEIWVYDSLRVQFLFIQDASYSYRLQAIYDYRGNYLGLSEDTIPNLR